MNIDYEKECKRRNDIYKNKLSNITLLNSIQLQKHINKDFLMFDIIETSLNREVLNQTVNCST